MRVHAALVVLFLLAAGSAAAGSQDAGRNRYAGLCARCHGGDGNGGELGPAIVNGIAARTDADLTTLVREGRPDKGMPGVPLADPDMRALIAFLRTLRPPREAPPVRMKVETVDGGVLEGLVLNQTSVDLQLLSDDHRVTFFGRAPAGTGP